ncbi:hypothetical protein M422DRAFT_32479 [Sphaerobolus stellatus SS14]|uniref:Transmembrane 9 superfamily member n=1 Tax=Sphaerobolus stellatus (strain SS14) TaxID=990650 RepID=A0A0C9UYC0_SPHS4|nr:hypothetical protein M422DRAFT_32479 [Sphaerobolus stellatus SS14]
MPTTRGGWLAAFALYISITQAFYLPGAAPRDYATGEEVDVLVNALTPVIGPQAKLKSIINYDYYYPAFHFCEPEGGPKQHSESLGSVLFGDRLFNSPYDIKMLENKTCQQLCKATIPAEDGKFINERIREDYDINWLVDGLPAAEMKQDSKSGQIFYDMGFELGNDDVERFPTTPALNNHLEILLKYHRRDNGKYRVVGVLVWPMSFAPTSDGTPICNEQASAGALHLSESTNTTFPFTYSVTWNESSTPWATRYDNYLHIFDPKIHWFSLVNSSIIVIFLCGMVSMILYRSVSRDISRYNALDLNEDVQEDYGWKLVWGEVFRTPRNLMALSVVVGNGAQLTTMVLVTLVFALLGFLSPSNRGALATVMLICWTLFGFINGYISTRVYASFGGTDFAKNLFFTATLVPTFIFIIMFLLNLFLISADSSGAVPFGTMVFVVLLWFVINIPLTILGGMVGRKHGGVRHPVRVNQIPRQIPPGPKYLKPWAASMLSGILPFGAAFVELYFVLSSIFASRAYYAFGFVALTAAVVGLTTATVTILFTYFILCAEEYRWHWRSFLIGGGSAFWLLIYGLLYWASKLSLDSFTSVVLYLGYLFLLAFLQFLVTGTIGFLATYWAMRKLYGAIRVD